MDKDKLELDLQHIHNILELIFSVHNDYKAACTLAQAAQDKIDLVRRELSGLSSNLFIKEKG